MKFSYKRFGIASIIAILLSLHLVGTDLFFGSTAKADDDDRILAVGAFTAEIDFATISLKPVGNKCLLEVDGELVFGGTFEGEAFGTTRALVFAPCDQVAINPPGTFKDVFRSNLVFNGTVDGEDTTADITYRGMTKVGGVIKARMRLSNGLKGVLKVDAIVAVGGSYTGFIKVKDGDDD